MNLQVRFHFLLRGLLISHVAEGPVHPQLFEFRKVRMHLYESAFDLSYRLRLFVSADEVIRQVLGAQLGNQAVTCVPRPYFARREAVPLADGNNKTLNPKP